MNQIESEKKARSTTHRSNSRRGRIKIINENSSLLNATQSSIKKVNQYQIQNKKDDIS